MKKFTVSMVVLTRDRPKLLRECLESITRQTVRPVEVIIVDDSIRLGQETRDVIDAFRHRFPVITIQSSLRSIPSARDAGAKKARGDIVIYLDDDLKAPPTYIESMVRHFKKDSSLSAVMGKIVNRYSNNIYASVQYAYYLRGLLAYFPSSTRPQLVTGGRMLDCEVTAIRRSVIKTFGFPVNRPNRYRNDDVDLGLNLLRRGKKILFDPTIIVHAAPRTSLWPLLSTAFWNGYSDACTEHTYNISLQLNKAGKPALVWIWQKTHIEKHHFPEMWYLVLLFLFPFVSRLGRLSYWLLPNL